MLDPGLGEAWIPASRWRMAALIAGGAVLVLASVLMETSVTDPFRHVVGWVGIVFFTACICAALYRIFSGDGVRLTQSGFTAKWGRSTTTWRWDDVTGFQVVPIGRYQRFAGFNLAGPAHDQGLVKVGHAMSGVDKLLPNMLVVKPDELAAVMNSWRARYATSSAASASR